MIGIIVDGPGDFAAFQARFKGGVRVLKTDGPRGHDVTAEVIVAAAKKQITMLRDLGCRNIIIVTDYENRSITYQQFVEQLNQAIFSMQIDIPVRVASPNIMIENWYLSDIEQLSRHFTFIKDSLQQKRYEGKHGKNELRKLFKKGKKGYDYNEVFHGPKLFPIVRTTVGETNSISFHNFMNAIRQCRLACRT